MITTQYRLLLSVLLAAIVALHSSAFTLHSEAGRLSTLMTEEMTNLSSLTINGNMDARDFAIIADALPMLTHLDISEVNILAYNSTNPIILGKAEHAENALPPQAFFGMNIKEIKLPTLLQTIENGAFVGTKLKAIDIPKSVTSIGDYAFYDCDSLENIVLSSNLVSIGEYAFANCEMLHKIDASKTNIKIIDNYAFAKCPILQTISLPQSIATIGEAAFADSGIKSITLPNSLTTLSDNLFAQCNDLQFVGIEANKSIISDGAFFYCPALSEIDGDICSLGDFCFAGDKNLRFESDGLQSVATIGKYALLSNQSPRLTFHQSLSFLDDNALEDMTTLISIDVSRLGELVPQLGNDVFKGINQPEVRLIVSDTSAPIWQTTQQWDQFDIVDLSSINDVKQNSNETKAWFIDKTLMVVSTEQINNISIYTIEGNNIALLQPLSNTFRYDTSQLTEMIYIVRVKTDNDVSLFKIIR